MFRYCLIALTIFALSLRGEQSAQPKSDSYQVPFRLTDTKHILVRAKINGRGPYNFILDTGAPALFVSTAVAKKLNIEADQDEWGTLDRLEIEGGAVLGKIKGKVADPFQLEGMNRMGLAGVELHGVIGYNVLARFRIELDFTRDKMVWTRLAFDPGLPQSVAGKAAGGADALAGLAKLMSTLLAKKGGNASKLRGFLGVELVAKDQGVFVAAVLKDSPAEKAGLKTGDKLTHLGQQGIKTEADVLRLTAGTTAGEALELTVSRAGQTRKVTVELGKGF